jgi:hypothetical protein
MKIAYYAATALLLLSSTASVLASEPEVQMLQIAHPYTLKFNGTQGVKFHIVQSKIVNGICPNNPTSNSAIGCEGYIYNVDCEIQIPGLQDRQLAGFSATSHFTQSPSYKVLFNNMMFTFSELTMKPFTSSYDDIKVNPSYISKQPGTVSCTINAVLPNQQLEAKK